MENEGAASSEGVRGCVTWALIFDRLSILELKQRGVRSDGGDHQPAGVQSLFPSMEVAQAWESAHPLPVPSPRPFHDRWHLAQRW